MACNQSSIIHIFIFHLFKTKQRKTEGLVTVYFAYSLKPASETGAREGEIIVGNLATTPYLFGPV